MVTWNSSCLSLTGTLALLFHVSMSHTFLAGLELTTELGISQDYLPLLPQAWLCNTRQECRARLLLALEGLADPELPACTWSALTAQQSLRLWV